MADWIVWTLATLLAITTYLLNPALGILVGAFVVVWAIAWTQGWMPASLD